MLTCLSRPMTRLLSPKTQVILFNCKFNHLVIELDQQCGFNGCYNLGQYSLTYTLKSGGQYTANWCDEHKGCSKHDKYELKGKCEYSIKIAAKNAAKIKSKFHPLYSPDMSPTARHPFGAALHSEGNFFLELLLIY